MKLFFPLFFFSSSIVFSLEIQTKKIPIIDPENIDCQFGYFYIDANENQSGGGHSGILIKDYVYHFQRNWDLFFTLDKTPLKSFLFNYSRLMNRNLFLTCIEEKDLNLSSLLDIMENEHIKGNFVKHQYLYLESLIQMYTKKRISIPSIEYFLFPESLNSFEIDFNPESLINEYDGNPIFFILKEFYKFYIQNRVEINPHYFFYVHLENLDETKKFFENTENQKKLQKIIKYWEKSIMDLEKSIRKDKYLSIFESLVYLETLKYFKKTGNFIIPIQIIKVDKEIEIYNPESNPYINRKNPFFLKYYYRLLEILQEENLELTQQYIQKISFFYNHFLLFSEAKNQFYDLSIQVLKTPQIPSKNFFLLEKLNPEEHQRIIKILKQQKHQLEEKYKNIFEYHLIFKNCVTELLKMIQLEENYTIHQIFQELEEDSQKIYTGAFIPWISEKKLQNLLNHYSIPYKVYYFPSFRNELLKFLKNKKQKTIQEISTLTSHYYKFNSQDSFFLFFTENENIIKPVWGLSNLIASTLYLFYDILQSPLSFKLDLNRDLRGLFFSFTEIWFISIRKGTFYPHPEWDSSIKELYFSLPEKRIIKNH